MHMAAFRGSASCHFGAKFLAVVQSREVAALRRLVYY